MPKCQSEPCLTHPGFLSRHFGSRRFVHFPSLVVVVVLDVEVDVDLVVQLFVNWRLGRCRCRWAGSLGGRTGDGTGGSLGRRGDSGHGEGRNVGPDCLGCREVSGG